MTDRSEAVAARALRYAISKAAEADCGDPLLHIDNVLTVLRREGFELAALRPEKEEHPEDTCQRCGQPNPVWSAPNDLWNAVMGTPDNPRGEGIIVCPSCFATAVLAALRALIAAGLSTPTARGVITAALYRAGIRGQGPLGMPSIVGEGVQAALVALFQLPPGFAIADHLYSPEAHDDTRD